MRLSFVVVCYLIGISVTLPVYGRVNINPVTSDLPYIPDAPFSDDRPGQTIDDLISVTEKNLREQKALKAGLVEYRRLHKLYERDTGRQDLSERLVWQAERVLQRIQEQHLKHAFEPEFLQELSFFSKIADKWKKNPRVR